MLQVVKKKCVRCKQDKLLNEFNKSSSTKDKLQPYCRECQHNSQVERNKKIKLKKRNTKLKRLSHYHLTKGLSYRFKNSKNKSSERNIIIYKCLDCGKEVEATLDLAWQYRFKCKDCNSKGTTHSLFLTKEQEKQNKKNNNIYDKLNKEHSCVCCSNKKENEEYTSTKFNSASIEEQVKIMIVPIPQYIEEPKKEKTSFFAWIKKLFR